MIVHSVTQDIVTSNMIDLHKNVHTRLTYWILHSTMKDLLWHLTKKDYIQLCTLSFIVGV